MEEKDKRPFTSVSVKTENAEKYDANRKRLMDEWKKTQGVSMPISVAGYIDLAVTFYEQRRKLQPQEKKS